MKKSTLLALTLISTSALAQGNLWQGVSQFQQSIPRPNGSPSGTGLPATTTPIVSGSLSATCDENKQTSLPLKALTSLIQQQDANLDIQHDAVRGVLTVRTPANMIGNCSKMLEWKMNSLDLEGKKTYALEVKFKQGTNCGADGRCSYQVAKMENGAFKEWQNHSFEPSLRGFEQCLQQSGVMVNGEVNRAAIYNAPVTETFTGIDQTGEVLFVSHGPSSSQFGGRYGDLSPIRGCDHYEKVGAEQKMVYSNSEATQLRIDAEAERLRTCNDVNQILNFEALPSFPNLVSIAEELILKGAREAATAINSGEYTEDHLRVMEQFNEHVVQPRIDAALALYEQVQTLSGAEKTAKQAELTAALNKIKELNRAPYFADTTLDRLLKDGKFEDAEKLHGIKIRMNAYSALGTRNNNVAVTPRAVEQSITRAQRDFQGTLETERQNYSIRTGETTGTARQNATAAAELRQNITRRTETHTARITEIQQQLQSGYCQSQYWRVQACQRELTEEMQRLQYALQNNNQVDNERATALERSAQEYANLELEGRRYVASQNGEELSAQQNVAETFNTGANQQMNQQQMMMMQMMMMQQQQQMGVQNMYQNPMGQTQQYPNFMGSNQMYGQFGMQAGVQNPFAMFNMGGMNGMNGMNGQQPINWLQMAQQQQMGMGQQQYNPWGQQMMMGQNPYGVQGGGLQAQYGLYLGLPRFN